MASEFMIEPKTPPKRRTKRPLFNLTDTQWQIVATALLGAFLGSIQIYTNYSIQKSTEQSKRIAEEVKQELNINSQGLGTKLDDIVKVGEQTHSIINSGSVVQAENLVAATSALAKLDDSEENKAAAVRAKDKLDENVAKQEAIDAKAFPKP